MFIDSAYREKEMRSWRAQGIREWVPRDKGLSKLFWGSRKESRRHGKAENMREKAGVGGGEATKLATVSPGEMEENTGHTPQHPRRPGDRFRVWQLPLPGGPGTGAPRVACSKHQGPSSLPDAGASCL